MSDKLKPCPFCGYEAIFELLEGACYVICKQCMACTNHYDKDIEAIKAWNTRPKPSVKWSEKKYSRRMLNSPNTVTDEDIAWNTAIDACHAAVDEAGLEYELDERKIVDIIKKFQEPVLGGKLINAIPKKIAHDLKLAERELIVRKE